MIHTRCSRSDCVSFLDGNKAAAGLRTILLLHTEYKHVGYADDASGNGCHGYFATTGIKVEYDSAASLILEAVNVEDTAYVEISRWLPTYFSGLLCT